MANRFFVCHVCSKRVADEQDYVVTIEKHEARAEEREHVECAEARWQKIAKAKR